MIDSNNAWPTLTEMLLNKAIGCTPLDCASWAGQSRFYAASQRVSEGGALVAEVCKLLVRQVFGFLALFASCVCSAVAHT